MAPAMIERLMRTSEFASERDCPVGLPVCSGRRIAGARNGHPVGSPAAPRPAWSIMLRATAQFARGEAPSDGPDPLLSVRVGTRRGGRSRLGRHRLRRGRGGAVRSQQRGAEREPTPTIGRPAVSRAVGDEQVARRRQARPAFVLAQASAGRCSNIRPRCATNRDALLSWPGSARTSYLTRPCATTAQRRISRAVVVSGRDRGDRPARRV
jgi:hypothetical protein